MDELYEEFEKLTINHEPLMAAGIMMAQAMKIYKAMLPEAEFKEITTRFLESRDDIPTIKPPTLN